MRYGIRGTGFKKQTLFPFLRQSTIVRDTEIAGLDDCGVWSNVVLSVIEAFSAVSGMIYMPVIAIDGTARNARSRVDHCNCKTWALDIG